VVKKNLRKTKQANNYSRRSTFKYLRSFPNFARRRNCIETKLELKKKATYNSQKNSFSKGHDDISWETFN